MKLIYFNSVYSILIEIDIQRKSERDLKDEFVKINTSKNGRLTFKGKKKKQTNPLKYFHDNFISY